MADIIIHGPPPSSYLRSVQMTCVEKGVSFELRPVEFGSDAHLALHPFGKVPILEHGDVRLYETQAILRYLDGRFGGPSLVPPDPAAAARMDQWVSVHNCYAYQHLVIDYAFQYIRPRGADGNPDRAGVEAALPALHHDLGLFDAALADNEWLAGSFSLADLIVAPAVTTAAMFPEGGQAIDRMANLRRWLTALESRDSSRHLHVPRPG
ncbi:MAG: glutathione S-transferase family protein [Myxococcota bacterium]